MSCCNRGFSRHGYNFNRNPYENNANHDRCDGCSSSNNSYKSISYKSTSYKSTSSGSNYVNNNKKQNNNSSNNGNNISNNTDNQLIYNEPRCGPCIPCPELKCVDPIADSCDCVACNDSLDKINNDNTNYTSSKNNKNNNNNNKKSGCGCGCK